jgi:hypothetical protein
MIRAAARPLLLGATLAASVLAGCVSVPQASPARDAEAKAFGTNPGAAAVYVYRNDFTSHLSEESSLFIDGRPIGSTLPGTFFRVDVRAGEHLLHGHGYDQGRLKLATRSGEAYFVALNVSNNTSYFRTVDPEAAKREIERCCVLMESWAPGQRPLLR